MHIGRAAYFTRFINYYLLHNFIRFKMFYLNLTAKKFWFFSGKSQAGNIFTSYVVKAG